MKNFKLLLFFAIAWQLLLFTSCDDETTTPGIVSLYDAYIVNYGTFGSSNGSITGYDIEKDTVFHSIYNTANGIEIGSNIQNAALYGNKAYFMSNEGDKIDIVDLESFRAKQEPIFDSIIKPRSIVFNGNYAYVSCWGGDIWADENTSYIAKINLSTNSVEKKIALPGGPEGLEVARGNLYAALNYKDSVAVIDMSNDKLSYIATPAVCSYFLKDAQENLYVSLVSTFSDFSISDGLGYLNTKTETLDSNYVLNGVSSGYGSIMGFNTDKSKIYLVASTWGQPGAIHVFDVATKSFENEPFKSGLVGINGLSVDPVTGNVYALFANGSEGSFIVYDAEGNTVAEQEAGISPNMVVFVK
jgi:hypothetical protein